MKSAITISLVEEACGGPFVLWDPIPESCKIAKQNGFDAVEIFAGSPDVFAHSDFAAVIEDYDLLFAAAGTGAGWVRHKLTLIDPDAMKRQQAIDFVKRIIDAVSPWQTPVIIGSMQGRAESSKYIESARSVLAASLAELAEYASKSAVELLIEPLNRYETNLLNTVEHGLGIIKQTGSDNLKLLCDIFHMNIEESSIAKALLEAGQAVGHVHFADSNRRAVGFGHIDYTPIIAALRSIDYCGYLSAEVIPLPDSLTSTRQTMKAYRELLA